MKPMTVWVVPCLLLCLSSCARVIPYHPDPAVLADCDLPMLAGNTYRDAVLLALERNRALQDCNDRLRALRRAYQ